MYSKILPVSPQCDQITCSSQQKRRCLSQQAAKGLSLTVHAPSRLASPLPSPPSLSPSPPSPSFLSSLPSIFTVWFQGGCAICKRSAWFTICCTHTHNKVWKDSRVAAFQYWKICGHTRLCSVASSCALNIFYTLVSPTVQKLRDMSRGGGVASSIQSLLKLGP